MAVLELEDLATITIERMIFHVVGPHLKQPEILTEVEDPAPYADFFAERLENSMRGSLYHFMTASTLRDQVKRALDDPSRFVPVSEVLATRFQEFYERDKRLAAGVLMFFIFRYAGDRFAAVVKFDNTRVISYQTESLPDGRRRAVLETLMNTFVQERNAMQKSAVISISAESGTLVCRDRAGQHGDLTDRFREFLDAKREFTHTEMTRRLYGALMATGRECADDLPPEVVGQMAARVRAALRTDGGYDPEDPTALLISAFGPLDSNTNVHVTFARHMKVAKIIDEPIRFDPTALPYGNRRIKETDEGVQIIYTPEQEREGYIRFENGPGGRRRVVIETVRFVKDDVLDEKARSSR